MSAKNLSKIRIHQTFDVDLVKAIHKRCMPYDDWYETKNEAIYWLAYNEHNNPVGFCILTLIEKDNTVFLSRSGVVPSARGHKLQVRFVRVRERYARKYDFKYAVTYTKIENVASSRNLQRVGFKLYLPHDPYGDDDCIYWIKEY